MSILNINHSIMNNEQNVTCLFDFDGTIVDSERHYNDYWTEKGNACLPHIKDFHLLAKGQALSRFLNEYFPQDIHQTIVDELDELDTQIPYDYIEGAEEFLKYLKSLGIKTGLVTNSEDLKMNFVYGIKPELLSYFDTIVTRDRVDQPKPDPQGYLLAAKELFAKPENCIVFEDSLIGMEAGRNAGMKVIGLATTHSREVIQSNADQVIDNYIGLTIDILL